MNRINVTDVTGNYLGWFDADKAEKFDEGTDWDGRNHISLATGSQWNHECVYLSASGGYFVNSWSQVQGSREQTIPMSKAEAAEWFLKNDYKAEDIPEDLNKELQSMEL